MNRKLYWTDFVAVLIVLLTLAGLLLTLGISAVGYLDEILTLLCILFIVYGIVQNRYTKQETIALVLIIIFVFIGLLGNVIFGYRTEAFLICLDIIASIKGMAYYFGFKALRIKPERAKRIINGVFYICFVYLAFAFVFAILNLMFDIGMRDNRGYAIPGFKFLYSGSGNASLPYYVIISCAALKISLQKGLKSVDYLYLTFGLVSWTLTLTSRAIGFSILYLVLAFFVIYLSGKTKFKVRLWQCAVLGILMFAIGWTKLTDYFYNTRTARYNLLYYGLVTMKNCFPIGAGFGSYGSAVAADYYSPLYVQYGFNRIFGLSKDNPMFSSDGLLGELFGQFGFLGTICFVAIFVIIFTSLYKSSKTNYSAFAVLYVALILTLGSIGTKTFMHFVITPVFILLAIWSKAIKNDEVKQYATFDGIHPNIQS